MQIALNRTLDIEKFDVKKIMNAESYTTQY